MVGEAGGVGVVLLDPQRGPVLEQAVEDVRCLVSGSGDDLRVEGAELVGQMAVEADPGLLAVAGVGDGGGLAEAARLEELAIGGGARAVTPEPGEREPALRLDQAGGGEGVGVLANVLVDGTGELPSRDPAAGLRHAA